MPRKKKTTRKSTKPVRDLTVSDLNQELERRRAGAIDLAQERAELLARVSEIDSYLVELGVSTSTGRPRGRPRKDAADAPARAHAASSKRAKKKATKKTAKKTSKKATKKASTKKTARKGATKPRGSRKRHRNDTNLVGALQQVLTGKVMTVTEVTQAVQDAGYKTTSPNFRTIVNQTLIKNTDVFEKQGRGLYTSR